MARKKDKIRVDLELPKDDKTQSNFIAILMVGMLLGLSDGRPVGLIEGVVVGTKLGLSVGGGLPQGLPSFSIPFGSAADGKVPFNLETFGLV